MPVEFVVNFKDGTKEFYYIPLSETLGNKPLESSLKNRIDLSQWIWVDPFYKVTLNHRKDLIEKIEIDPDHQTADIVRKNNLIDVKDSLSSKKESEVQE
jgi:hypothetical protein